MKKISLLCLLGLLSGLLTPIAAQNTTSPGTQGCSSSYVIYRGADLLGNDLYDITATSAVQCCSYCTTDLYCNGWTFVLSVSTCYLKYATSTQLSSSYKDNPACDSGYIPGGSTPAPPPPAIAPTPSPPRPLSRPAFAPTPEEDSSPPMPPILSPPEGEYGNFGGCISKSVRAGSSVSAAFGACGIR